MNYISIFKKKKALRKFQTFSTSKTYISLAIKQHNYFLSYITGAKNQCRNNKEHK